jgi:signal transduction histidine kinase
MTRVLVVDDNQSILKVVAMGLQSKGFDVITASNGREGLERAIASDPDLILLDIEMPEVSGLQVCEQLQENPSTRNIPIIFLSALSEIPDRIRGLDLGAVDYVVKPFDVDELMSRVKAALRVRERHSATEHQLDSLKKEFLQLVSTEMTHPLSAIRGFSELLELGLSHMDPTSQMDCLREINRSSKALSGLLDDFTILAQADDIKPTNSMDLMQVIREVVADLQRESQALGQTAELSLPSEPPPRVPGHPRFLTRAVHHLIANAQKYAGPAGHVRVVVAYDPTTEHVKMMVEDNGPGIAATYHEKVFEKFFQLDSTQARGQAGAGMGIGLPVARAVARGLGGDVTLWSLQGKGSRFTLSLPAAAAAPR